MSDDADGAVRMIHVLHGDCREIMPTLGADSFDSIVTDPPYEQNFMGRRWDRTGVAFRVETWEAAIRVLKPGGHLLAFGGTRTYHRMVCAIEDAGFEIRDCIRDEQGREIAWPAWVYATGFPKSLNVSAAIDDHFFREWLQAHPEHTVRLKGLNGGARKEVEDELRRMSGLMREAIGESRTRIQLRDHKEQSHGGWQASERTPNGGVPITAPATPEAEQWTGWGTSLKPAWEPICVARKPLSERNIAANVLKYGCGALNIDACRIPGTVPSTTRGNSFGRMNDDGWQESETTFTPNAQGRFPANLIHDGSQEVLDAFAAFGEKAKGNWSGRQNGSAILGGWRDGYRGEQRQADSGTAARFFFSAKANSDDRLGSKHPTVKPTALLAWLLRLVTPTGGHVLDPFAGSGSTGMAAMREGFDATLIELEEESVKDIHNRLAHVHGHDTPLFAAKEDAEQPTIDLFDGAA